MELDPSTLRRWPLPGATADDKRARGTVLVIGGTAPTAGATVLAGLAALRIGAGRLQLAVGASVATGLAVAVPEAMVVGLPERADGTIRPRRAAQRLARMLSLADVVLVGPGLIGPRPTRRLVAHLAGFVRAEAIVVLDAEALLAGARLGPDGLRAWRARLALTPNRDELAELLASPRPPTGSDNAADVAAVARRFGAAVTSYSDVAAWDGRRWTSPDGGVSLATSGSGDVLAGLVAGAAARSGDVAQAVCWATFVHARCAQLASRRNGPLSVLARDLLDEVPHALHELEGAAAPTAREHAEQHLDGGG